MDDTEFGAWSAFVLVTQIFLGNYKAGNYSELVDSMLSKYNDLGCNMSNNVHYLHNHLQWCSCNSNPHFARNLAKLAIRQTNSTLIVRLGAKSDLIIE